MKLSHTSRRSYRRPARSQRPAFFSTESPDHAPPQIAAAHAESRQQTDGPFLQAREDGGKAQEEEEAQPKTQEEEEEAAQPKAQEEEEEAAQPKAQEEEEEAAQLKAQEEEEEAAQPKAQEEEEEAAQPKAQQEEEEAAQPKAQEEEEEAAQPKAQEEEEEAAQPKAKKDSGAQAAEGPSLSRKRAMAESAVGSAKTMAGRAIATLTVARKSAELPGEPPDALKKFECWFGEFDHARAGFVQGVFERIQQDLTASDLMFFFNGKRREYAHVYPSDGGLKIWLSRLFWQKAGGSGFNSQPGTLLHELSHKASAAVDDFRYGPGPCKGLARANPSAAVRNADNYAYFAESL